MDLPSLSAAKFSITICAALTLAACNESDRLGAWKEAKIREACFGALEQTNMPALRARDHRISLQARIRGAEMMSALECYVVTNRQAVCEKNNRAYIVDYISRYYRFMDEMYREADSYGPNERSNVDEYWNDRRHHAISAAVYDHILKGRINYSDFGWSRPARLEQDLAKYKKASDACPGEPVWQPPGQPHRMRTFQQVQRELR
jgi:hypothetical protein